MVAASPGREILIEGCTPGQILSLPQQEIDALLFTAEPLLLQVGSAQILGQLTRNHSRLVVELAEIEGGGEGVLPTLWLLLVQYAREQSLAEVEWIVYAVTCARPNPKLLSLLERRGFALRDLPGHGRVYHQLYPIEAAPQEPTGGSTSTRGYRSRAGS